ncbi:MAG TPA: hypothetical protein ENJ22_01500 [Gammaproteobacteria bacterium]|nr:hypothetical protein [Gammaproteobacteria bacterium]
MFAMNRTTTNPAPSTARKRDHRPAWRMPAVLAALLLTLPVMALDLKAPPRTPLAEDGIHDPTGEAIDILQDPAESMKDFPKDRRGEVDWVQAIQSGIIKPRKSRTGDEWEEALPMEMDFDIIMKNTMQMPWVRFPHKPHTQWLACSNCHPKIFIPREDANPISMTKVLRGQYCGVCHDKVSFSLFMCERCHSVPHKDSPPPWWEVSTTGK